MTRHHPRVSELLRAHVGTVLMSLTLTASLTLNVLLGADIRLRPAEAGLATRPEPNLIGKVFERVDAVSSDGVRTDLAFTTPGGTLVYYLSPSCGWCVANYDNIVALASSVDKELRVVGLAGRISPNELASHLKDYPLPFPTYVIESDEWLRALSLFATPTLVHLDEHGSVTAAWVGALRGTGAEEVSRRFNARLPGLRTD